MRRMSMNYIDTGIIDQAMGELDLQCRYLIAPVASPVNRNDSNILRVFIRFYAVMYALYCG